MKRKFFTCFLTALLGFVLSVNFIGCKKEQASEETAVTETTENAPAEGETAPEKK